MVMKMGTFTPLPGGGYLWVDAPQERPPGVFVDESANTQLNRPVSFAEAVSILADEGTG
jgi:hypothetical protein